MRAGGRAVPPDLACETYWVRVVPCQFAAHHGCCFEMTLYDCWLVVVFFFAGDLI